MVSDDHGPNAPHTTPFLGTGGGAERADVPHLTVETKAPGKAAIPAKSLAIQRPQRSLEPSPGPSGYSHVSASAVQSVEHGAHHADEDIRPTTTPTTISSNPWRAWGDRFWLEYKGVVLMILSQMFGAMMSTTARYLQTLREGVEPMSTFQVLFVRMSVTMVASLFYMWWAKVPHAPFGVKSVRKLLLARGFGGFFGDSLIYLPLAEATVITFLAPLLAAWICSVLIKTPFTRVHKFAGFMSIGGVVLIAQPFHFLGGSSSASSVTTEPPSLLSRASEQHASVGVTPAQRASAVALALVGVGGAACAYTTISWIGKQAHPLISVNYFATWCTVVSTVVLVVVPGQSIRLPVDWREWLLITFLGCSGFVMQFLLTAGLSHDRNRSKALNMAYTQMLFALAMDKLVWGHTPGALSIVGSSMILGSAIWVAVLKEKGGQTNLQADQRVRGEQQDEEVGLVEDMDEDEEDETRGRDGHGNDGIERFAIDDEEEPEDDIELKELDKEHSGDH